MTEDQAIEQKYCPGCGQKKHVSYFYRSRARYDGLQSVCKECRNVKTNVWRKTERGKDSIRRTSEKPDIAASRKKYYKQYSKTESGITKTRSGNANYRKRHPERAKESERKWSQQNPDKVSAKARRRRMRHNNAAGYYIETQLQSRVDYFGGLCWVCGKPYDSIDHVKPLAKGGANWPSNLRPICRSCNSIKSDHWRNVDDARVDRCQRL